MITYVPINLTNKKFYVGSAVDFDRRWRQHLNSTASYPFQNALRKNPDRFFVLVSEDDGLDTRDEEQFYLDFYHGSEWCYNLSSKTFLGPEVSALGAKSANDSRTPKERSDLASKANKSRSKESVSATATKGGKSSGPSSYLKMVEKLGEEGVESRQIKSGESTKKSTSKTVELTDESGETTVFSGIREACRTLGISSGGLVNHLKGRTSHIRNYTARYV